MIPNPEEFFDLSRTDWVEIYDGVEYLWEALSRIPDFIAERLVPGIAGEVRDGAYVADDVYIGDGTVVEPGAYIGGPTIIGRDCQIRHGAYIRGNAIVGNRAVVGHGSELKNVLLHDEANVPHLAYVGDSILGWRAHLGAGVVISNLKVTHTPVIVHIDGQRYPTGLRKFGCIMGDEVEIGCNSVVNPGTLLGKRTLSTANTSLYGYYPPNSFVKLHQKITVVERR
ncbi:MAG: hypothetical protein ACE5JP_15630 [Candidatus Bipolaricaulia bacterium]